MRWPIKKDPLYKVPLGTRRALACFAWWPVQCYRNHITNEKCWVWLETFFEVQEVSSVEGCASLRHWRPVRCEVFDK